MTSGDPWNTSITLTGRHVQLIPMRMEHIPGLIEAGKDVSIWKYMLYGNLSLPENMTAWVQELLVKQATGTDLPFTVFHIPDRIIIGATRYMEMRPNHRGLEIGGTWYATKYQQTGVNTESKYLLIEYAFDTMGCIRVQFKVDGLNAQSIRAIERLGAVQEGVLRNHYIRPDGTIRDSVYFSIIGREWQAVKTNLEQILDNYIS